MVIGTMNLILVVGRRMIWIMKVNLCPMTLKKILEIKYTYVSLTQLMAKYILWRVTIFFICQIMDERGGLFRAKQI